MIFRPKIIGIDYGDVRIGIAISDEIGMLAHPHSVIKNSNNVFEELKKIVELDKIELAVVGFPLNMKGEKTKKTLEVEKFIELLKIKLNIEVKTIDERLTSVQAHNINRLVNQKKNKREDKSNIDKYAAAIILQVYLDSVIK